MFDDLNWQVDQGEFHVVLGASGSGKTTLLRLIAGLELASAGRVSLGGRDMTRVPPHLRGVAMVSQNASTYDHLSVAENLRFAERLSGATTFGLQEELVGQFELSDSLHQKPSELSGGQLQRLAIVRALLTQRQLLLMDEPLAHLQESLRRPIRRLLKRWQQQRKVTCIYVTHDSQEACELSDRISVLGNGKILQTGDGQQIYRQPTTRSVAELMGRPAVEWFLDPRSGGTVGARPIDWELVAVKPQGTPCEPEFNVDSGSIRVVGRLISSRVVESSRWYEIQCGELCICAVVCGVSRHEVGSTNGAWNELPVGVSIEISNHHPVWIR